MFFSSFGFGSKSDGHSFVSRAAIARRSRLGAIVLAATLAAPASVVVFADPPAAVAQQTTTDPAQQLQQGVKQFNAGQYEESAKTLSAINADVLSASNQSLLRDTLYKAQSAAAQRQAARAEFEAGERALKAGMATEAALHYKAAAANTFADSGTKQKSKEQLALARSMIESKVGDLNAAYRDAMADYKAGRYADAKQKFQTLDAVDYKPGLFQKSPADYLKAIASKATVASGSPAPDAAPAAPVTQPTATSAPAPAPMAAPQTQPAQSAQSSSAASGAPAISENQGPEHPIVSRSNAKALYSLARSQYEKGDWIEARKNFLAAQAAGYKPGLFEDSPAKYLDRMDKKEADDAQRAAEAASRQKTAAAQASGSAAPTDGVAANSNAQPAPAESVAQARPTVTPTPAPVQTSTTAAPAAASPATAQQELNATSKMEQVNAAQRQAEARRLVGQASAAANRRDYTQALKLYTQATELDPNNAAAVQGRNDMLTMTGRAAPTSQLQKEAGRIKTARQEINYQFDQSLNQMRAAIAKNNFTAAEDALNRARVARNSNPNVFTPEEIRTFEARLASAQSNLTTAQQNYQRLQANKQTLETQQALEQARKQQEAQRVRTVADLTRNARQLIDETRYKEALDVLDQILVLDPTNDYATGVRPLVEDKALLQEQRRYREDFNRNVSQQFVSSEEMKIPYNDILRYPTNWPDISAMRDQTNAQELGHGAVDAATQAQLDKKIPEIRFDNISFDQVVNFLRDMSGANIFVNWRALEQNGIDKNTPVSARLHDVKFSKALQTILADVGGGAVKLGYTVDEGVITISTEEDLSHNVITRTYDIRDLIVDVPDFFGPQVDLSNVGQNTGGGLGGGGGGNNSLFSNTSNEEQTTNVQPKTRDQLVKEITDLITQTIVPESWRASGGTVGSLSELSGQLIVTQTPDAQRQIQNLLDQLRETRAIQITIETRFLTVQRNFLEDIGFDTNLILNANMSDSNFSRIPITQNSSDYTANPQTGLPGSITVTSPSIQLSGTYLDNFEVQFLLRATQASQSSTLLTAPRLTLFNGQRAYVAVTSVTAYVSDLTPVVAQGAVAFNPQVSLFPSGVVLDVQATVSADRKYVTLTLRPTLTTLLSLIPFTFQSAQNTTTTQPTSGSQTLFLNGSGTNEASGTIQQPIFQLTQVRTTVSVPDGGTLLLGGQTLAGETEREAGVPVLSKIPFLKRLFTNRSMAKDEQVLLILVKPTIVISREQEQKQFPLLSNRITQ